MAASRHFVSPVHANERRSDQKTPARRALLIGIGKYDSLKFPTLEYPVNDVARMSELLRSPSYGFQVTEITDDKGPKPTRDNILAALQRYLVDEPNEGDTVLFYYSGHGSWVTNSLSHETDKRDETIVPSDAVRPVTKREDLKDIRDKEIAVIFDRALAKKIKLTAIFDSCHSGSIARGDEQSKEVDGVEFDIHEEPTPEQEVKPEENGTLVLSAAEDYQQASGGRYTLNGVDAKYSHFTAELLQSLYDVPADRQSAAGAFSNGCGTDGQRWSDSDTDYFGERQARQNAIWSADYDVDGAHACSCRYLGRIWRKEKISRRRSCRWVVRWRRTAAY